MELTIKIDTRQKTAQVFLELMKNLNFIEIIDKKVYKKSNLLLSAIEEADNKQTKVIDGNDELSKYLIDDK
jgi:hypothetical protein